MAISIRDCGAAILAGGKSRRMGQCKAKLELGGETLLTRLSRQLSGFPELWISANDPDLGENMDAHVVQDLTPGMGPLAGLQATLRETKKEALLCVPCDLPFFTAEDAAALTEAFPEDAQAMVCREENGQLHPLCGIYRREILPVIDRRLEQGQLRMRELLEEIGCVYYTVPSARAERMLMNVNTPEAFAAAQNIEKELGDNI